MREVGRAERISGRARAITGNHWRGLRKRSPNVPANSIGVLGLALVAILASMSAAVISPASSATRAAGTMRAVNGRTPRQVPLRSAQLARPRKTHPPRPRLIPLPTPAPLTPFAGSAVVGQGRWRTSGRLVRGLPAVFETNLAVPAEPGVVAGVAWMDTHLLQATLYSGSASPGGLFWKYTAPIQPAQAKTLVAAFNGGFKMPSSNGGYYSEGKLVSPLRRGAASLVVYKSGLATVGMWGRDATMTSSVVAVRQNLGLLVDAGHPTTAASSSDWLAWGATCAVLTCSGPGIENQWRSGLGVTADGALVYVAGPSLSPLQLAELLVRAGAMRAMELDINPYWPTFATYAPSSPSGPATPANGVDLLAGMTGSPARFFEAWWARDFITLSSRSTT